MNTIDKNDIDENINIISTGVENNSYEQVKKGLLGIGKYFNITEESLDMHEVTRENLFKNTDEVIVIQ
jgi:hypothetical protein